MPLKTLFIPSLFMLLLSCGEKKQTVTTAASDKGEIRHAKKFAIIYEGQNTKIYLFGNRYNRDTTARYLVTADPPENAGRYTVIPSPCKKIAALSSIYASMLVELGATEQLVAIDNIDYVNNPVIRRKFNEGQLKELARGPEPDVEQAVMLRPEVLLTFGMGDGVSQSLKKLEAAGIPVAISIDHLEESPLARAEWIKFFGAFAGKRRQADSIFKAVEKSMSRSKITCLTLL
jgi:iron complex transport system substrate-binding protein